MLVGDIINNYEFDCNCNIEVYKSHGVIEHRRGKDTLLYNSRARYSRLSCAILDMKVKYITVKENTLIIEAIEED